MKVRDEGYSPSPDTEIDRDEGYSPSPDSVIDRDEGYSPSPDSVIDRDEGYSPSPDSVSISCDQNTLFFTVLPRTESLVSHLCTLRRSSSTHHTFLSCLPQQDCVWPEFPVCGQV
jgi:hypothetical protein